MSLDLKFGGFIVAVEPLAMGLEGGEALLEDGQQANNVPRSVAFPCTLPSNQTRAKR